MLIFKRTLRVIIFIICFVLIFSGVSNILERKSLEGAWNMTLKVGGFYNEPVDSLDVMFFGSSHMYCSIDPRMLEEQTGLKSYVFATQQQPLWISYHYLKEALKTQSPETVVLEVHMVVQEEDYADEGTLHSAVNPIKLSRNKVEMVYAAVPHGERRNYILDIFKYHDRWEELTRDDYTLEHFEALDPLRGFVQLETVTVIESRDELEAVVDVSEPLDKSMEYLEKFVELSREEGFELILIKAPSNATVDEKKLYNAVEAFALDEGITFEDFNMHFDQLGLDLATDFYDRRHLNVNGVAKFVPYFGAFLMEEMSE
ncbi:MAG: hypothetical protein K8R73_03270 [Clostridiales bacterium]|nr:hypothetical protein [Clostridiales bacterium]